MYTKILRSTAMLLAVLVISSCATRSMTVLRHDLATQIVCCNSFSGMSFSALTTEETDLTLGHGSSTFAFDEGKSYFGAYSLPMAENRSLIFSSYLTTEYLPDTSVFMPSFVFLDKEKKVISVARNVPMQAGGTNFWTGQFYVGHVAIPQLAAYVVVYTSDTVHQPLYATSENGRVWPVPASLSGTLKVAISR